MSTMQELIHRNAKLAYQQGSQNERQKTLALLNYLLTEVKSLPFIEYDAGRVVNTMSTIENIMSAYVNDSGHKDAFRGIAERCHR